MNRTTAALVSVAWLALAACGGAPPSGNPTPAVRPTETPSGAARVSSALMQAAVSNNAAAARSAIETGADVNAIDASGANRRAMTPLTAAAANQSAEVIETLLENNANVNARDGDGQTALHEATLPAQGGAAKEAQRAKVVALLLDRGADPNATNKQGVTPLMQAALHGPVEVVDALIGKGARVNPDKPPLQGPPLLWATDAKRGTAAQVALELKVVQALLAAGAQVNVNSGFARAYTPLYAAAFYDKTAVARALLDKGADVNATVEDDQTALMAAASNGNRELVELLVAKGADVNAKSAKGQTVLDLAASSEIADLLKAKGAR